MKEIKTDKMPKEVATEMLATPGVRTTNRERKQYRFARQKEFCSELERKPVGDKIRARAQLKPIDRLDRERRRVMKQRRGAQHKYERLQAIDPRTPVIEAGLAALDLLAAHLDTTLDALNDEIKYRLNLTQGVTEPTGALVWNPELKLLMVWTPESSITPGGLWSRWTPISYPPGMGWLKKGYCLIR